ncbi:LAME_0E12860g1_1 [Lachancea meyersii CBS 8951]|uniref:LAME_0E12860g1_1 n=1 Tax=Lachancea meyersii CBS 8951 TaxID=1266667 RepID=A0A1G4JLX6_9SACH|nr:LAME_0E12860g1_1 [Lachancea meyersii CBS 8951]
MGYIQFDKIAVPEDNLVSLGLLHRQLQKQQLQNQKQQNRLLESWATSQKPPTQNEDIQPARPQSGDVASGSPPTALSSTFDSLAQMWADIMGTEHQDYADPQQISHRPCSTSTDNNSSGKPSLDEELCGLRFDSLPFTNIHNHVSPYTRDMSIVSTGSLSSSSSSSYPAGGHNVQETPVQWVVSSTGELVSSFPFCHPSSALATVTTAPATQPYFECSICSARFRVKGYLTRHLKKHMVTKEFRCPFWTEQCRCHSTGEFSRKDTYKTHLKSIHFVYPVGVAKSQRNRSKGRCAACYQEFDNNAEWLEHHIMTRRCDGLVRTKCEHEH